jgi:ABC-2 type transport system permease protein
MIDKLLRFLDLFQWVFKRLNVDYRQFRMILWAKLTMDNRRTYANFNPSKKKPLINTLFKSLLFNAFIGLFIGLTIALMTSVFLSTTIVFTVIMIMTGLILVTDFTSVLLDTTDNAVLLPRPVDSRTILAARITHIATYLLLITLSLALVTIVIGTAKFGLLFLVAFVISLLFSTLLVVFLTNVFYIGLMRITSGETFRDIILYIQVFTGIFFIASYQVLPRIVNIKALKTLTISIDWWAYLFPPAWMAGTMDTIVNGNLQTPNLILLGLTLLVPVLSIFVVIRFLGPTFNQKLAQMDVAPRKTTRKKGIFYREVSSIFSRLLTRTPAERTGFEMTWKLAARDRKFKLNTYPAYGAILVGFFLIIYFNHKRLAKGLLSLPQTHSYLVFLYILFFIFLNTMNYVSTSDHYLAAWIYRALPINKPGEILSGALKSIIVKNSVPYALVCIFSLAIWGAQVIDDIVFAFLNIVLACVLLALVSERSLPFSRKQMVMETNFSRKIIPGLMVILLFFTLALIHAFLLRPDHWAMKGGIIVLAALSVLMFRIYKNTPWRKIVG